MLNPEVSLAGFPQQEGLSVVHFDPNKPQASRGKPPPRFVRTNTNVIMATVFDPIRWTVPGYLAEGLSVLAGRQKLGKTWLAIDFALAVATGGIAMGSVHVEQGDVLYIDMENGPRRIQRRIETIHGHLRDRPDLSRLEWVTEAPQLDKGFIGALEDWRQSVRQPRLVVIDVLQRIKPAGNANRNSYENDYALRPSADVPEMIYHESTKRTCSGCLFSHRWGDVQHCSGFGRNDDKPRLSERSRRRGSNLKSIRCSALSWGSLRELLPKTTGLNPPAPSSSHLMVAAGCSASCRTGGFS